MLVKIYLICQVKCFLDQIKKKVLNSPECSKWNLSGLKNETFTHGNFVKSVSHIDFGLQKQRVSKKALTQSTF